MKSLRSSRRGRVPGALAHLEPPHASRGKLAALAVGALGVVYGDIGTSPLYAIDQIFVGPASVTPSRDNVLGAISLSIWTITLIVAIKYALLVLRADNDREGGVFALYGLLHKYKNQGAQVLLWLLMVGADLLFGDGMITPAISVLSAVEGLKAATLAFTPYVVPITIALLTGYSPFSSRALRALASFLGHL
jgi:KUP system potassium uptake protein